MNSKIATLLSKHINNTKIIPEMINYICDRDCGVEDHLIDLCLGTDENFITKDMILKHIDKIKSLCMKYMDTIQEVSDIKIIHIDNIASQVCVGFKAKVAGWYRDKESADRGHSWEASTKETNEYKFKGIHTNTYSTYMSFKDIDQD